MKYIINTYPNIVGTFTSITVTIDDENFLNFPAEVGNPNYDQFLDTVNLTDEEVHALPTDEWIEA